MGFSFKGLCTNVVPKGTYKSTIEKMEFVPSKNDASVYNAKVTFRINEGTYAKRTVLDTISTAFASKLSSFLTAAGVDMNKEFTSMAELYTFGIKAAVGKAVMIDVSIRKYNGQDYNQVDDYKPLPGSTTSAAEVLAAFNTDEVKTEIPEPEKPTVADIPTLDDTGNDAEPSLDINLDDVL